MQMKLRKVLAAALTLAMLCALLPLGTLAVSAAQINLVTNGDFEKGTTGWIADSGAEATTQKVDDAHGMSGRFRGSKDAIVYQNIAVNSNTSYTVSFDLYIPTNHISVWITGGDGTVFVERSKVEYKTGVWQHVNYSFNSGNNTYVTLAMADRYDGVYEYYVDNVTMMGEPTTNVAPGVENPPAPEIEGNLVKNYTFESGNTDGWSVSSGTTVTEDAAHTGDYGMYLVGNGSWNSMANQTITTEVGKKYNFSAYLKTDAVGANVQIKDGDTKIVSQWFNATEWTKVAFEFTATSTQTVVAFSGAGNGNAEKVCVDDVCVLIVTGPSYDGYIYNGDFETGSLSKWESWQSTVVDTEAAHDGNYGCKMIGTGGWGATLKQNFTAQAGMTYKITFWYKGISNGINFQLIATKTGDKLVTNYLKKQSGNAWTLYEATFESAYQTDFYLNFCGSGIGTKDELWIDEIKIENLSGGEMDRTKPLKNSGISIRDVNDDVRGLAFRFFLDAAGVQVQGNQEIVSGTGTIKLFNYADTLGTLVEAGAIVSNDKAVADNLTMEAIDNKKTIKIAAKYLTDVSDTTIGYSVRIVEIPDNGVNRNIYARPYYTYELNGEQVTIYGDMVYDNYGAVSSVRTSIKVLAIGNSFSVDAMKNHLYDVYKSAGYDQVILGNLYIGGCSLDTHWRNLNGKVTAYEWQKNDDNGKWVSVNNYDALTALQEETWDIITVQQVSSNSGQANTYGNLQNIVNWVNQNKTNPDAKVLWHMTWAYQKNSTHEAFPNYNKDQMTMYNAIVDVVQNTVLKTEGIDGVIPSGTAIQNLRTSDLGDTLTADGYHLKDSYGDYTAALMWYVATTGGESLDKVTYVPDSVSTYIYDIKRAVARAYFNPYAVSELGDTILLAGSDFQPKQGIEGGLEYIGTLLDSIAKTDGYTYYDGWLAGGDYTTEHGHDPSTEGLAALDAYMSDVVNHNKIYSEGNHDAPTTIGLNTSGNNDPLNGPYGVFVINEEDYGQFGGGGDVIAVELKAYLEEKLADPNWGNKPVFVMSHVPLHYSMRTIRDQQGRTAMPIVNALNDAGAKGLNIIFLFGHNHSEDYDAFLGGGSIYLKKGDSVIVPSTSNYKNPQSVKLNFTYMNSGYIGYYPNYGYGSDNTLTMTTFRIKDDGSVIITRYDANGLYNLKSKGVTSLNWEDTFDPNPTVYGPIPRIVTATGDEEYKGN